MAWVRFPTCRIGTQKGWDLGCLWIRDALSVFLHLSVLYFYLGIRMTYPKLPPLPGACMKSLPLRDCYSAVPQLLLLPNGLLREDSPQPPSSYSPIVPCHTLSYCTAHWSSLTFWSTSLQLGQPCFPSHVFLAEAHAPDYLKFIQIWYNFSFIIKMFKFDLGIQMQ